MSNDSKKEKFIQWQVPEYQKQQRGRNWYIIATLFVLIALFFCFFSVSMWQIVFLGPKSNFLFALIIVMSVAMMVIHSAQEPRMITIRLAPDGVYIGKRFYDHDSIKTFCVLYKPKQSIKNLYFEFNNKMLPRLSVPLRSQDPLAIRNFLVRFQEEDLDRTAPPLSETLTNLFKL